jgi:type IV pilus assembly protein PilF
MRQTIGTWLLLVGLWMASACTTTTTVNGVPVPEARPSAQQTESDPRKRAEIRLQLAGNYYQKGQLSIALEEVRRALQADPNYGLAHSMLGLIYLDLGDRREAEASYAHALRLDPGNPEVQNNHGWYLCQTGRERESIDFFQRAAGNRLYRTPGLAMQNAGLCMLRLKDTAAAEGFLRRSFELDAGNPMTKYQLARLYLANKQVERANFYYGLLEKGPNAPVELVWLGLRIARANADLRLERQLADELRRRFPNSAEAAALARGAFDE